ncbi:MAG TPA: tetratricopeptide repeat protein [Gemmatimonadaceae bacterium]|nr:tetratricopeptide repeat protein [Gemmatimonadaceae bacterium]
MSARSELDAARPALAQLDVSRGPEKAKSDLMTVWSAVEAALRSLVGGSTASGQTLIRDARSRQLLSFDQANALVAFLTVREQLDRPDYVPTEVDANTARSAFLKLDAGLMAAPAAPAAGSPYAPGAAASAPYVAPAATTAPIVPPAPGMQPVMRRRRLWIPILLGLLVLAAVPIGYVLLNRGGSSAALDEGIRAYQSGDKQTAASKFEQAARAMPDKALPHVYLSRMAREVGNYTVANQELQLALRAEPRSLDARREYGSLFLAQGNFDLARNWYVRALEVNPQDRPSQGWLGCALIRLNRLQEGMQWLNRAGSGPWSSCMNAAMPAAPGVLPP